MTPNVGSLDKSIRLVAGAILIALALLLFGFQSTLGTISLVVGAILIVTAMMNFCPLFKILGISSTSTKYSN